MSFSNSCVAAVIQKNPARQSIAPVTTTTQAVALSANVQSQIGDAIIHSADDQDDDQSMDKNSGDEGEGEDEDDAQL